MEDGRIGRFEVPEGTSPDQAEAMIREHLSTSAPNAATSATSLGTAPRAAPKEPSAVAGIPGAITTMVRSVPGMLAGGAVAALRDLAARAMGADRRQGYLEGQEAGGKVAAPIIGEPSPAAQRTLDIISRFFDATKLAGFNPLTQDAAIAGNLAARTGRYGAAVAGNQANDIAAGLQAARESKAAQVAPKVAVLKAARDANLTLLPSQTNPSLKNLLLEGYGGKQATEREVSAKNAREVPKLVQEQFGVDEPLVPNAINTETGALEGPMLDIRAAAHEKGYVPVKESGQFAHDTALETDLNALGSREQRAAAGFPNATIAQDNVTPMIEGLKQPTYDAGSTIDMIGVLRQKSRASRTTDPAMADAYLGAADALESRIERHLAETGQDELLKNFQDARTTIAQTHDVEPALSPSGDINASAIAARSKKVPLTGNIKTIADAAREQEKAFQQPSKMGSVTPYSPLDTAVALGSAVASQHWPAALAALGAVAGRPLARKLITSSGYQAKNVIPNDFMQPGLIERLANSVAGRSPAPVAATAEATAPIVTGTQIPAIPFERPDIPSLIADRLTSSQGPPTPFGNEIEMEPFLRSRALARGEAVDEAAVDRARQAEALKRLHPPASLLHDFQWLGK